MQICLVCYSKSSSTDYMCTHFEKQVQNNLCSTESKLINKVSNLFKCSIQLEYGMIRQCEFCFQWSTVIPLSVAAYKSQDFAVKNRVQQQ